MDEINAVIRTPTFWIFGVVLALILSILGNYATRILDFAGKRGLHVFRARTEKAIADRERLVTRLMTVPAFREAYMAAVHQHQILGFALVVLLQTQLLLIAIGVVEANPIGWVFLGVNAFLATRSLMTGAELASNVRDACTRLGKKQLAEEQDAE